MLFSTFIICIMLLLLSLTIFTIFIYFSLVISHLPNGPTAHFKVSSFIPSTKIKNHASLTGHMPEVILNQFSTRLGHRVGRFLGSLFPHKPEFVGRRVVTFHNQRDFIFLMQHRYIILNEFLVIGSFSIVD